LLYLVWYQVKSAGLFTEPADSRVASPVLLLFLLLCCVGHAVEGALGCSMTTARFSSEVHECCPCQEYEKNQDDPFHIFHEFLLRYRVRIGTSTKRENQWTWLVHIKSFAVFVARLVQSSSHSFRDTSLCIATTGASATMCFSPITQKFQKCHLDFFPIRLLSQYMPTVSVARSASCTSSLRAFGVVAYVTSPSITHSSKYQSSNSGSIPCCLSLLADLIAVLRIFSSSCFSLRARFVMVASCAWCTRECSLLSIEKTYYINIHS